MKVLNRIWNFKGKANDANKADDVKKKFYCPPALFTLFALFILFTFSFAASVDKTLATVDGEALYQSDFNANMDNVLNDLRRSQPGEMGEVQIKEIHKRVLNQMVDDLLLLQDAKKKGLKTFAKDIENGVNEVKNRFRKDEEGRLVAEENAGRLFDAELKRQRLSYAEFEERIKKQLLVIKLVESEIKSKAKSPAEQDIKNFFDQVKAVVISSSALAQFKGSEEDREETAKLSQLFRDRTAERVRARHILLKLPPNSAMADKSKVLGIVKDLKKRLSGGADFADLAKGYSQDTESAKKGGDLGYFIRGWMVPAFEAAAFSLPVGQVSDPVETEFGYHLIYVEEKRAATPLRIEEVRDDLAQYIYQRNIQTRLKDYVAGLRAKANVKILEDPSEQTKAK